MFQWMPVAPQALKSVFPIEDSFSNKEMRTFSRIGAYQSTSYTFNTSLWRRKTKPASVNYFAITVLATNKTGSRFPWQVSTFSVLWNIMFEKWLYHNAKKNLFHISTNIPTFFPVYWLARWPSDQFRCLQWKRQPSHLSCFLMIHLDVFLLLHRWLN